MYVKKYINLQIYLISASESNSIPIECVGRCVTDREDKEEGINQYWVLGLTYVRSGGILINIYMDFHYLQC